MNCIKCKFKMKISENNKFWFCDNCGSSEKAQENNLEIPNNKYNWTSRGDGSQIDWLSREELSEFPYLIAHEYDRIRSLLEDNQPYGAIMQLKDTYETITKYFVLVETVRINNKKVKSDEEVKIIKELTEKLLLLSNWQKLLDRISTLDGIDQSHSLIMKSLSDILRNNGSVKFIEWRNRILGHGALGHMNNIKYKNEFIKMLDHLTNHLKKYSAEYKKYNIYLNNHILLGVKIDDKHKELPIDSLTIANSDKNNTLNLYPFIVFTNSDVYFFDSFDNSKKTTDLLSYPIGDKLHIRKNKDEHLICNSIAEIHMYYQKEYKKRNLNQRIENTTGSFEDDVFLADAEKLLLDNCCINDSVKAKYFESWIQSCVKNNNKGVFIFQAAAEMGKTTAIMQLEGRINNTIGVQSTSVKAVYLNDSTNRNIGYILDSIEHVLYEDSEGKSIIRTDNKIMLKQELNKDECKKNFADFINTTKRKLEKVGYCREKLILVIDGIDELREDTLEILDYIPNYSQLDEGIYILITSRTNEEISNTKRDKINEINYTNRLTKQKNDEDKDIENLQLEYVKTQLPEENQSLNILLSVCSKNTFLSTHLVVFLLKHKIINAVDINESLTIEDLLIIYFNYLTSIYNKCNRKTLFKIVYLLASDNKDRELKEISYSIGENKVSFTVIGVLQDLRALLRAEHNVVNRYRINHTDLSEKLLSALVTMGVYEETEMEIVSDWKNNFENISYWDPDYLYSAENSDDYGDRLNELLTITNTEFDFLMCFYDNPLSKNYEQWIDTLTVPNYLNILFKLFDGANSYLNTTLGVYYKSILAEKIYTYLFDYNNASSKDSDNKDYQFIALICMSFSDWRQMFIEMYRNGEIEKFKKNDSVMHSCYELIKAKYKELKEYSEKLNEKVISQEIYNFILLLEEALIFMTNSFIDLNMEISSSSTIYWQENLININKNSIKRYDDKMNLYMELNLFIEENVLLRSYYTDNQDHKLDEVRLRIAGIKKKLSNLNLNEFQKLTIKKDELYTELEFMLPRALELRGQIPKKVLVIANRLTEIIETQFSLLRVNSNLAGLEDKLSDDVRVITNCFNEFVIAHMHLYKGEDKDALKLITLANKLFEELNEEMREYYLLQRLVIVTNYVILLNKYKIFTERDKYIDWYLEKKEEINSSIAQRKGQICETAEHSTWLLEMIVAKYQKKNLKEVIDGIFKYHFEIHMTDNNEYRARCTENHYSRQPTDIINSKSFSVKFNKKFCNTCNQKECLAYKGIHKVKISEENSKFIEI